MDKAEKIKESWQERKTKIKKRWHVPFIHVEWKCEQLSDLLGQWAFLEILEHLGRLTIIVAVIFYFMESGSRRKAKHYQAWQVINVAQGKTGNGGRMDALQDLYSEGISLAGVDISKAYLPRLKLENADLSDANLAGVNLKWANLTGANLWHANLTGADLLYVDLSGADLSEANLAGVRLICANLAGAHLLFTDFTGASLTETNFSGANLRVANFTGARLAAANLTGVSLQQANLARANLNRAQLKNIEEWKEIKSIKYTNIYGVIEPPDGFIEWAIKHGAVSIEDDEEWKKLISEKDKQEADNS